MRYWETEHKLAHSWWKSATGYWSRYPNKYSSHVFSVDTLETRLEPDGTLYCKRLIMKTNPLPSWGKHFFAARRVAVIEECRVDAKKQVLTWYVRNVGLTKFMATYEKATLTPNTVSHDVTKLRKQVWIDSSIIGFRSAIKSFGMDRYKKNCILATQGFTDVLNELFGGGGSELKEDELKHRLDLKPLSSSAASKADLGASVKAQAATLS